MREQHTSENFRVDSSAESRSSGRLDLPNLVDRILELNPTAKNNYLNGFGREDLAQYLDKLEASQAPRGTGWVRRGDKPGMVAHRARDARE